MTDRPIFYQNFGEIQPDPFVSEMALFLMLITDNDWPKLG